MQTIRNYYEILGLPQDASRKDIVNKFRELVRQFHPDLIDDKAFGQRVFTQVHQAYRTLSDPDRRAQYDEALRQQAIETRAREALRREVEQIDRNLREAETAMLGGQAAKAYAICQSVVASHPRNAHALRILGDALAHFNKTEAAVCAYRASLEISPSYLVEAKVRALENLTPPDADDVSKIRAREQPVRPGIRLSRLRLLA